MLLRSIRRTPSQLHPLQQIPTQHDILPQHLVYRNELNREYVITLARNDETPCWWSETIKTCRSSFMCFKWKLYRCICWLIFEVRKRLRLVFKEFSLHGTHTHTHILTGNKVVFYQYFKLWEVLLPTPCTDKQTSPPPQKKPDLTENTKWWCYKIFRLRQCPVKIMLNLTQVSIRQVKKNFLSSSHTNPYYELSLCKRNLVTTDTRRNARCVTQYHTQVINYCLEEACIGKPQYVHTSFVTII